MSLTPEDLKQIGYLLDEKLEGVHERLDGVEAAFTGWAT